jgi:hypothetical protein
MRETVADLLRRNWNPYNDGEDALFEDYVEQVVTRVREGVPPKELAQFLASVEAHRLGYQDTPAKELVPVAKKLLKPHRNKAQVGAG